jgi:hypothetical protein
MRSRHAVAAALASTIAALAAPIAAHAAAGAELQTVTVNGGSISLPFLAHTRPDTIQGDPSVKLESYKAGAPFAVPRRRSRAARRKTSASRRSRHPPHKRRAEAGARGAPRAARCPP